PGRYPVRGGELGGAGPRCPLGGARDGAAAPGRLQRPRSQHHRVGLHRQRLLGGSAPVSSTAGIPLLGDSASVTPRAALPLFAALLVLLGSGLAAQSLHRSASGALARVTEERLRGAGATAARTLELPGPPATQAWLRAVMEANGLEGAFIVGPDLRL